MERRETRRGPRPARNAADAWRYYNPARLRLMADPLWQLGACDLAESVAARIDALNPELNAIVVDLAAEALAEARRADAELAAGRMRGPLHGVPVTIKENVDQAGKPTPNGIPAFRNVIAPDDAP